MYARITDIDMRYIESKYKYPGKDPEIECVDCVIRCKIFKNNKAEDLADSIVWLHDRIIGPKRKK